MDVSFLQDFFGQKINTDVKAFSEVSTDTRSLKKDSLFVALKGENFDGNKFVLKALEEGALAAITSDQSFKGNPSCVVVEDSLIALQNLGRAWQDHVNPKVIAITGSNGKTTAKFFTHQILKDFKKISFSPKSFNNEIGVPFTQVNLEKDDEILISEIGTNNPGEIEALTKMVSPHASVVTTVGPSHIERFHTLENIAIEKSQIYKCADRAEMFIFNLDNEHTLNMKSDFKNVKSSISISIKDKSADIYLEPEQVSISELKIKGHIFKTPVETTLAIFGEHHVYNLMVALSFGSYLGIDEAKMIEKFDQLQTPWGRCQIYKTKENGAILFDAYNANLQSNKALLESAKKINMTSAHIILGEMFELGDQSKEMHFELGRLVGQMDFESVSFIGEHSGSFENGLKSANFKKNSVISSTYDERLAIRLKNMLNPSGTILIKGSRGIGLEKLLPLWVDS